MKKDLPVGEWFDVREYVPPTETVLLVRIHATCRFAIYLEFDGEPVWCVQGVSSDDVTHFLILPKPLNTGESVYCLKKVDR